MAFEQVRRVRRSARVVRTGLKMYLGFKRTQRKARKLPEDEAKALWLRRHESTAEEVYRLAVDLKGMFIKTAQFAGTRSDVFPEPYVRSLSRLQDRVPVRPVEVVERTIREAFGRPPGDLFASFEREPMAAASLAQVHRARLHDGREVCVKVQYPEVAALVKLDVRNLRTLSKLIARREPNFDYTSIVNELGTQVPLELDFVREAALTKQVAANLAEYPGIVVPTVVDEFVSAKVLVTEFLPGQRLLGEHGEASPVADGAATARAITEAFGHQILVDGLFQADPHPGNLLALPDGRIGLIDFGLTKELPAASRIGFARLVVAAAERNPAGVMEAFRELGLKTRGDNPEDLMSLTALFFDARPGRGQGFQRQRREVLNRSPIDAIPGDLVLLGRVVGLLRGVCSSLGSPLTPMQMLRPHAERALASAGS